MRIRIAGARLTHVHMVSGCSNRRHGWFNALVDLLSTGESLGVGPVHVAEDGKCMFHACLASMNLSKTSAELIGDCVAYLESAARTDADLCDIVPTLSTPIHWDDPSVLDLMPAVLSKVLQVEILIVSKLNFRRTPEAVRVTNSCVPTQGRIVLFHILNTLVTPEIYHYLGSRPLNQGQSATLPDEYTCPAAQPDQCRFATAQPELHPLLWSVDAEDHDQLGFEYAKLYAHVLCGSESRSPIQFLLGDATAQDSHPALRFRTGTCYYFHPTRRSELSFGQNWRVAILDQAALFTVDRGTLLSSASADVREAYQAACSKACQLVKVAVAADLTLVRIVEDFRDQLETYDRTTRSSLADAEVSLFFTR